VEVWAVGKSVFSFFFRPSPIKISKVDYLLNITRNQWATTTFYSSLPLLTAVHALWQASIATLPPLTGIQWIAGIQPLPIPANNSLPNSLGIPLTPDSSKLVIFQIIYLNMKAEEEVAVTKVAQKLINDINQAARSMGLDNRYTYLNYATWWQDPIQGYGNESVRMLKETSRMYDPTGFFQTSCPGGFKLSM
jgi:hypothetical protein